MGEPRAITFQQLKKAGGGTDEWRRIGYITGAGTVPLNSDGDASIDITNESPEILAEIDQMLKASNPTEKKGKEK